MRMYLGPKPPVKLRQRFRSWSIRLDISPSGLLNRSSSTLFLPTWTLQHSGHCLRLDSFLPSVPSVSDPALRKAPFWALLFLPDCSQKASVLSSFEYTLVISPPRSVGGTVSLAEVWLCVWTPCSAEEQKDFEITAKVTVISDYTASVHKTGTLNVNWIQDRYWSWKTL